MLFDEIPFGITEELQEFDDEEDYSEITGVVDGDRNSTIIERVLI